MKIMIQYVPWLYLLAINVIAFVTMGIDKRKAKKGKWRISEKTLFLQAIFLGSLGAMAGMYCFRHKTKHKKFVVGMPAIFIIQIGIVFVIFYMRMR